MRTHVAYCSARDQQVRVVYAADMPEHVLPSPQQGTAAVCLAYGEQCTGELCPMFDVSTERMREWLKEHGPDDESVFIVQP